MSDLESHLTDKQSIGDLWSQASVATSRQDIHKTDKPTVSEDINPTSDSGQSAETVKSMPGTSRDQATTVHVHEADVKVIEPTVKVTQSSPDVDSEYIDVVDQLQPKGTKSSIELDQDSSKAPLLDR